MRDRPIHDLTVQIVHLRLDIGSDIPGVLIIYGAHDDFQLVSRLVINNVALRLAPVIYTLSDYLLQALHIVYGEECGTHRCHFPVPPEHIRLKIGFDACLCSKTREAGVPIREVGSTKGHASILSGRGICCLGKNEIRRGDSSIGHL